MTIQEINDVIPYIGKLDPEIMDIEDQMQYVLALNGLAERLKPLIIKYLSEEQDVGSFLFKL